MEIQAFAQSGIRQGGNTVPTLEITTEERQYTVLTPASSDAAAIDVEIPCNAIHFLIARGETKIDRVSVGYDINPFRLERAYIKFDPQEGAESRN